MLTMPTVRPCILDRLLRIERALTAIAETHTGGLPDSIRADLDDMTLELHSPSRRAQARMIPANSSPA